MGDLKERRLKLGLTTMDAKRKSGVPTVVIVDLETDERYRAHPVYESYRDMLVQVYSGLELKADDKIGYIKERCKLYSTENSRTILKLLKIVERNRKVIARIERVTKAMNGFIEADKQLCVSLARTAITDSDKLLGEVTL